MSTKLKTRKNLQALTMALACGMVFTMVGQAEAADSLLGAGTEAGEDKYQALTGVTANVNENNAQTYVTTKSAKGAASDNDFTVTSGTWYSTKGGFATTGTESANNKVTIQGATITGGLEGGYIYLSSMSGEIRAINNKLLLKGASIFGTSESAREMNGGYARGTTTSASDKVIATKNTIEISEQTQLINVKKLQGGYAYVYGASDITAGKAIANENTVTITGDGTRTFNNSPTNISSISGGYAYNAKGAAEANGNILTLAGGTFSSLQNAYGGYALGKDGSSLSAKDNIVNLGGWLENGEVKGASENTDLSGTTLYGGFAEVAGGSTSITGTGNTLNVFSAGNKVGAIGKTSAGASSFQSMNFYIPAGAMNAAGSNTMLTINSDTDLSDVAIKAGVTNVGQVFRGTKLALIGTGAHTLTLDEGKCSSMAVTDGIMNVELSVYKAGDNRLMAEALTGDEPQASEQAKSPVETQAAGVSLVNQGSDMLAVAGLDNAAEAAGQAGEAGSVSSMAPFAAMGGSNQRIHSGSYVDMKAWNINLGLAKEITNKYGKLLFGPMLEYGHGSYDSYLDDGTHGSGKSKFFGGGLFAKETYHDGLYVEGSLRAGRAKNDYRAIIADKDMSYDNSATYLAAHLGVGKEVALNEKDSLDYYGKLFYSHQNSSRATLKAGYTYDFDAVDSFRTRIGARYTHKLNDFNKIYAGLAWQHEFDSKCRATIHAGDWTNEAPAPSVKGDTGILELGWKVKPGKGNFETGLGFTGSVGKQEGIGFNASFQWNF